MRLPLAAPGVHIVSARGIAKTAQRTAGRYRGIGVFSRICNDQTTVLEQAQTLCDEYGVKDVVFVADRGMLVFSTPASCRT